MLVLMQGMCVLMLFVLTCTVLFRGFVMQEPLLYKGNELEAGAFLFCVAVCLVGWAVVAMLSVGFDPIKACV